MLAKSIIENIENKPILAELFEQIDTTIQKILNYPKDIVN